MRSMSQYKKTMMMFIGVLMGYFVWAVTAGDLNPPAPPTTGTMKTLTEVEPRIAIAASASPTSPFSITQSGSYYLTGDRFCGEDGIVVDADHVTIDLCGYSLIGPDKKTYNGIVMKEHTNIQVRNGTVRNFYIGIVQDGGASANTHLVNMRVVENGHHGIYLPGSGHLVRDCTVSDNGASAASPFFGIYVAGASVITSNSVCSNGDSATGAVYAIYGLTGLTITSNSVYYNGHNAADNVYGIYSSSDCTVTGNTVFYNGLDADNNITGIRTGTGCTVTGNTANYNGRNAGNNAYGLYVDEGCTVTGNTANGNGRSAVGTGGGIRLGDYCLVDQNAVYNNGLSAGSAMNMATTIATCVYGNNVAP